MSGIVGMLNPNGGFCLGDSVMNLSKVGMVKDTSHTPLNSAPPAEIIRNWPSEHYENNTSNYSWKPAPWGMTNVNTVLPNYDFKSTYRESGLLDGVAPEFHDIVRQAAMEYPRSRNSEYTYFGDKNSGGIDMTKMMESTQKTIDKVLGKSKDEIWMDKMLKSINDKPLFEPKSYTPHIFHSELSTGFGHCVEKMFSSDFEKPIEFKPIRSFVPIKPIEPTFDYENFMKNNKSPYETGLSHKDDDGVYQGYIERHIPSGESLHFFKDGHAHVDLMFDGQKYPFPIVKLDKDNQGNPIDTRIKHLHGFWP